MPGAPPRLNVPSHTMTCTAGTVCTSNPCTTNSNTNGGVYCSLYPALPPPQRSCVCEADTIGRYSARYYEAEGCFGGWLPASAA
jgi:hypothetical protein